MLGAHYDHLGRAGGVVHPGADDNASGTAVVLGMARALAAAGGTARTLVVVFFSGEEIGLLGSAHYVKHPPLPIERTAAMLNFDMVGRMRNDRLNVGGVESGGGLRALVERVTSGDRLDLVLRDSPYESLRPRLVLCGGRAGALLSHRRPRRLSRARRHRRQDQCRGHGRGRPPGPAHRGAARRGGPACLRRARAARWRLSERERPRRRQRRAFLGVSVDGRSESDGVRLGSVIAGAAPSARGCAAAT